MPHCAAEARGGVNNPDLNRLAVLFDLDGTLVDLRWIHFEALNRALAEAGYDPISREDHVERFDGLPTSVKLEMLGVPNWLAPTINQIKQRHTGDLISERCGPDDRLNAELERIQREAFIAVVSNALNTTCIQVLLKTGLAPYVEMLIAGPHERGKPWPDPYLKAIEAAHLVPDLTIAVEDNHYGLQAAERAGLRCLQVASPDDITYQRVMEMFR